MNGQALLRAVAALLCFASAAGAQVAAGTDAPTPLTAQRTGDFTATLTERSRESEADRWKERFQFEGDLDFWDYDLATETFSVYVPPDYDADAEPYGVVVWVSASDGGGIPAAFKPLLDERHLIWIGPDHAGNDRHIFVRAGLALDAALDVERVYHVDGNRIFVSGLSGGGRMAAMLAVDYPDVFDGGFPVIGLTTYQNVPIPSTPGTSVPRFPTPSSSILARARRQPFVIMTGSGDFNREECLLVAEAYERDGFTDLHLLDIEGMEHEMPSPENFARGLDLLLGVAR